MVDLRIILTRMKENHSFLLLCILLFCHLALPLLTSDLSQANDEISYELSLKWSVDIGKRILYTPSIADIDRDGKLEIIYCKNKELLCFDSYGDLKWSFYSEELGQAGTTIADIDRDGKLDVVVGTYSSILCINHRGKMLWEYNPQNRDSFYETYPAIYDIDKDGQLEIVATCSDTGSVYILDNQGNCERIISFPSSIVDVDTSPSIADLDNDGIMEILMVTATGYLNCLTIYGEIKWSFPVSYGESTPCFADLDHDGKLEVLYGDTMSVFHCLDYKGNNLWNYTTEDSIFASPCVADIDADGSLEVLVASSDHFVYCFNSTGGLEWKFETGDRADSSPSVTDFDGDGTLEILFGSDDGNLYCLNHTGGVEWLISMGSEITATPCIGDLEQDGYLDVIVGSWNGNLSCFTSNLPYTNCISWLSFLNGPTHNGHPDSDNDGLDDLRENYYYGTSPTNNDSDGDGLPDGWEVDYGLNPLQYDALGDPDDDKLNNVDEYLKGHNPTKWDNLRYFLLIQLLPLWLTLLAVLVVLYFRYIKGNIYKTFRKISHYCVTYCVTIFTKAKENIVKDFKSTFNYDDEKFLEKAHEKYSKEITKKGR